MKILIELYTQSCKITLYIMESMLMQFGEKEKESGRELEKVALFFSPPPLLLLE